MTKVWLIKTKFDIIKFRHFNFSLACEVQFSSYIVHIIGKIEFIALCYHDCLIFLLERRHNWIKGYDCDVIIWSAKISSWNQ